MIIHGLILGAALVMVLFPTSLVIFEFIEKLLKKKTKSFIEAILIVAFVSGIAIITTYAILGF